MYVCVCVDTKCRGGACMCMWRWGQYDVFPSIALCFAYSPRPTSLSTWSSQECPVPAPIAGVTERLPSPPALLSCGDSGLELLLRLVRQALSHWAIIPSPQLLQKTNFCIFYLLHRERAKTLGKSLSLLETGHSKFRYINLMGIQDDARGFQL